MSAFGTLDHAALDRYITGNWGEDSIQEPPPQPRCDKCRAYLPFKPDRTEPYEDAAECDGTVKFYDVEYDEGSIAILGSEYRGKTYQVGMSACGIDTVPHAPHREVFDSGLIRYTTCRRCGHENKDAG